MGAANRPPESSPLTGSGGDTPATSGAATILSGLRVGLLIKGFASSYYGLMVEGAADRLKVSGVETLVQSHTRTRDAEFGAWMSLLDGECDGLIAHVDSLSDSDLQELMSLHDKVVLMNRRIDGFEGRCAWFDNEGGGRLAAEYLMAQGHQKFATVTGPERFVEVSARSDGFRNALADAGCELLPEHQLEGDFREQGGSLAMQTLMQSRKPFSAVFFHNDEMAIGALAACEEKGLRVPEDLSIVSLDDIPLSGLCSPGLTTIRQPLQHIGEASARLMLSLLESEDGQEQRPSDIRFDPVIVERGSVSRFSGEQSGQRLTPREIECLTWASKGKTAWEISVILSISRNTVTFHLVNAADKLNASNRTHAVAIAIRERWIP